MRTPPRDPLNMTVGPFAQIERLDVRQHRIQTGKQREQDAAPALLVAAALPVRFEEPREEPPNRAMHIKALTGQNHAAGRRVDIVIEMSGEATALADQRQARMNFAGAPDLGLLAEQARLGRYAV